MRIKPCSTVYHGIPGACQVHQQDGLVYQTAPSVDCLPGTLTELERTPGAVAVSGLYGREPAGVKIPAGIPKTNTKPGLSSLGFFVEGATPLQCSPDAGGGSWSGESGESLGVILEAVAKRSEGVKPGLQKVCPAGVITGSCGNGHRFAKEVYCGREWCEVCNGKWEQDKTMKPSHARRLARWYPKAQQFSEVGYWTFTIPQALREKYRTKEALGDLGHKVQELLKSYGYSRGLRRWHYFGDRSQDWHPHLNCLVDGGFLGGKALRSLRREYSHLLGVKLAIAEYHYISSPGQKVHALKYITRATFLDWKWDAAMAKELHGFRNQLWWGSRQWDREPVWSLDDLPGEREAGTSDSDTRAISALELGYCPYDGLPITWERFQVISRLPELGGRHIGAGYWELPYVRPPPYLLDLSMPERSGGGYGKLAKTIGGSYVLADIALSRWAEFEAQHKRRVKWLRELEAIKSQAGTLPAEVLEPVKNGSQNRSSLGGSAGGDKNCRKPNCLGSPPVVGKN